MNRLVRRQRAALALFIALTVSGVGVALAGPESGDQPGRTLDLNPHPPYAGTQTVNVFGAGFQSGGSGVSGIVYQAATLPDGTTAVGLTSVQFTSNAQGTFTSTLQVSPTFRASGSGGADFLVDCNAPGVTCFVEATSNSGAFSARHPISFGSSTTAPPTTAPPTTAPPTTAPPTTAPPTTAPPTTAPPTTAPPTTAPPTTAPPTTAPPTTAPPTTAPPTTAPPTTAGTTTTTTIGVPPTTPGASLCDQIQATRGRLNAQIDAVRTSISRSLPAQQAAPFLARLEAVRTQGLAQLDAAAQTAGCPTA